MSPKNIPASEPFYRALRDRDFNSVAQHFKIVYDKMTSLASLHEAPERKPAFYEKQPQPSREPEIPSCRCEAYTITKGGRYWKWNCGWWEVDPATRKVLSAKPLGHTAFRRKPIATTTDEFFLRRPRPFGEWRRVIKDYLSHNLFGNVYVDATDGIVAIITVPAQLGDNGQELLPSYKTTCMYANLTEIATPMMKKLFPKAPTAKPKPKKDRAVKLKQNLLDLL